MIMGDRGKADCWICLAAVLVLALALPLPVAASPDQQQAPTEPASAVDPPQPAPDEAAEQAGQKRAMDAFRALSVERRDEAVATARRAADDLDRQMEQLQRQMDDGWGRMSQATRNRSQATMTELRQRRTALAEWFGGMRHSSGAAWGEVRGGFVTSYHEMAEALRRARAEFAQDDQPREADTQQRDQIP